MATNPPTMPPAMLEALGRLWTKFLPEIEARLAILNSAVRAVELASLSGTEREAAHQAAHKLAGVLGTFGLHRGTELARQAEVAFAGDAPLWAADLSAQLAELRMLIEARK